MAHPVWTPEFLDAMRQVGDPLADAVVAELFAGGADLVREVNGLLHDDNDADPSPALPQHVRDYLARASLPDWADPARLTDVYALFIRHGHLIIMLLGLHVLPMTYAARKGVQVLARTDRMYANTRRRIVEAAQMIIDVLDFHGLDPNRSGRGLRSAQKVRLIHAAVRHRIGQDPTWDPELGVPINQEDLAGMLCAFSVTILDGLQRLGADLTDAEIDVYMHTWRVVGHVMGVRAELLPADHAAGKVLTEIIGERQFAASPEGQKMTAALLETMVSLVPGSGLDAVPAQLVRFFVGDRIAQILAIPDHGDTPVMQALRGLGRASAGAGDHSRHLQKIARRCNDLLLDGVLLYGSRGGRRLPFDIPTELRQVEGVNWH